MATVIDVTAKRRAMIRLDPPGTVQGLADALDALIALPGIGPGHQVESISGGPMEFVVTITRLD